MFMEMKGKPIRKHHDSQWLCDPAVIVDITKYSQVNFKLEAPPASQVPDFKSEMLKFKLSLWKVGLKNMTQYMSPLWKDKKYIYILLSYKNAKNV